MNKDNLVTSISLGVNQESYDLIGKIVEYGLKVDFITITILDQYFLLKIATDLL